MKKQEFNAESIVRAIIACKPSVADADAISEALGASAAPSLMQVARGLGVSYATVKQTLRPAGMPGNSRARHYPWAPIVVWYIDRLTAAHDSRTAQSALDDAERRELGQIQLAAARADLEMRQTKLERERKKFVPLVAARAVIAAMLNRCRDVLCRIPARIEPTLPAKYSRDVCAEVDREIRAALTIIAETPTEEMLKYAPDMQEVSDD